MVKPHAKSQTNRNGNTFIPKMSFYVCLILLLVIVALLVSVFHNDQKEIDKSIRKKSIPDAKVVKTKEIPARNQCQTTNEKEMIKLPDGRIIKKPKSIIEALSVIPLKPGHWKYNSVDELLADTNRFMTVNYKTLPIKTRTEAHLKAIASMPRDLVVPPIPPISIPLPKRDWEDAFANVIRYSDDDTKTDRELKRRMNEMKHIMKALIDNDGYSVQQAIQFLQDEHNRNANLFQLYRNEYKKMLRKDNPDSATFRNRANEILRSKGAPQLDAAGKILDEE